MNGAAQPQREPSLAAQIAQVERRLELRRQRTVRHFAEARAGVAYASRWLPLVGVAGALAVGLAVGRRPAGAQQGAHAHRASGTVARTGMLASLAGLAGAAIRIAMSPQARALWVAYRSRRPGGPLR